MELCIRQSLRRIVDIAEMGLAYTSKAPLNLPKLGEKRISFGSYFTIFQRQIRIERSALPKAEELTDIQSGKLALELENSFNAMGKFIAFPANVPLHLRYPFLRQLWNNETAVLYHGKKIIEPCREHELECKFRGYCRKCEIYDEGIED